MDIHVHVHVHVNNTQHAVLAEMPLTTITSMHTSSANLPVVLHLAVSPMPNAVSKAQTVTFEPFYMKIFHACAHVRCAPS